MMGYANGRLKGNRTIHAFRITQFGVHPQVEPGLEPFNANVWRSPACGSGLATTGGQIELTDKDITCKKCNKILYR